MERFFFDEADFQYNFAPALGAAIDFARAKVAAGGQYSKLVILTVGNNNLATITSMMNQQLGMSSAGGTNRVPNLALNIMLTTTHRYRAMVDTHDFVISCGLDSNELLRLENDNAHGIDVNVEVKDYPDISLWGNIWGVQSPHVPESSFAAIMPAVHVQHALDQISGAIGLYHTHDFHPSDDEFVKTCVLALHHHLGNINSDEVLAYVLRVHRWPLGIALKLKVYFDTLNNGRHFKGGDRHRTRWNQLFANW